MENTLTGEMMESLNQFLTSKQNGVSYTPMFQNFINGAISLGGRMIEKGLWDEASIQNFEEFLPTSVEFFSNATLHPSSIAQSQAKFKETARVAMLSSTMSYDDSAKKVA